MPQRTILVLPFIADSEGGSFVPAEAETVRGDPATVFRLDGVRGGDYERGRPLLTKLINAAIQSGRTAVRQFRGGSVACVACGKRSRAATADFADGLPIELLQRPHGWIPRGAEPVPGALRLPMMMWPFCPGSAACFDAARDAMNAHRVLVFFSDDTPDVDPTQYHPTEASIFAVTLVGDAESHLTREHPYRIPTSLARGRTSEGSKNNSPLVMRAVSLAEAHLRQSLLSLGAPCRGCGGRPDPGATLTSYCAGNGKPPNHCSVTVRAVPSCTQAKCRAAADRKLRSWAKTDECLWDNCRKKVRYPCSYGNCKSDEPASQRCSVCRMARYCSRECQIADYPAHKSSCSRLEKGKDDKENAGGNRERSSGMERMGGLLGALPPSVPNLSAGSPAQVQGIRAPAAVSALVGSMASSPLFAQSGSRKFLLGGSQLLGLPMEELLAFEARVEQQLPVAADDLAYLAGQLRLLRNHFQTPLVGLAFGTDVARSNADLEFAPRMEAKDITGHIAALTSLLALHDGHSAEDWALAYADALLAEPEEAVTALRMFSRLEEGGRSLQPLVLVHAFKADEAGCVARVEKLARAFGFNLGLRP